MRPPHDHRERRRPPKRLHRALVVDDEATHRVLLRVNLEAHGVEVDEAVNGLEALEAVHRQLPDVILLDMMLPGMQGIEVATLLAADARTAAVPIVFISARADTADQLRALATGAWLYLTKPFDPVLLAGTVERLLERLERGDAEAVRAEAIARLDGSGGHGAAPLH